MHRPWDSWDTYLAWIFSVVTLASIVSLDGALVARFRTHQHFNIDRSVQNRVAQLEFPPVKVQSKSRHVMLIELVKEVTTRKDFLPAPAALSTRNDTNVTIFVSRSRPSVRNQDHTFRSST
jgi:hypothetical protein